MKCLRLVVLFTAAALSVATCFAVKVDSPGQAEEESAVVLTGTIVSIESKKTRDASYEWTHCVASVRVESLLKGEGVKVGDLIPVRYLGPNQWLGQGTRPPGPGGHNDPPAVGEKRQICLSRGVDGGWDVYYVSGFSKVRR